MFTVVSIHCRCSIRYNAAGIDSIYDPLNTESIVHWAEISGLTGRIRKSKWLGAGLTEER